MTLEGVVKDGTLVFDHPLDLANGTRVQIDFTGETVSDSGEQVLTGVLYIRGSSRDAVS